MTVLESPFSQSLQEIHPPKDPLQTLRTAALKKFQEMGLPERKDEAFHYFPLRSFYEMQVLLAEESSIIDHDFIERHVVAECRSSCLVFIDGRFRKELSMLDGIDPRIGVFSLDEAMKTFGHFLQSRLSKQIKEENDPFALLNLAVHPEGAFLYIPPKVVSVQPIQILLVTTQEGALVLPRLQVFVGSSADVKLHFSSASSLAPGQKEGLGLAAFDLAIEEGARLETSANSCGSLGGWQLEYVRATLKRDSFFSHVQLVKNTALFRKEIKVDLQGENATAELSGLSLLRSREMSHLRALVQHEAPHTRSSQHFKAALFDSSQSCFEGDIIVQKLAQKTDAYQLCNHLLLSDLAIANTKPNLEIFADDVKASHGATASQLKGHELFYLHSRGIGIKEAKTLLIEGFCEEISQKILLASLREGIGSWLRSIK